MAELPTGTVTFLFTDIEGSTRLLQELGPRYAEVRDRQAGIVRRAVEDAGGVEVSTAGDSFFCAFASPSAAVRAAVAAQRDLAGQEWPAPFRVRMGIHTGEGVPGGDDYVGIDVNRGARIADAAHGGQVLLSDATRALVEQALPDGVSLRDLGPHRLKDLRRPEHLHDLVIAGVPADFPPPRSLDARPNNLPAQLTSFVGRDRELAELLDLMGRARLITLTGPGGTGKTRLALRLAEEALPERRDGCFFVDLSSLTSPDLVPSAIALAVGAPEVGGRSVLDALQDHLRERELLLVLDNFEQVVEAAPLVERLLASAPGLQALVTSRTLLSVRGEHEFAVSPLAPPDPERSTDPTGLQRVDAVRLFLDRAVAADPRFRLDRGNASAVAGLVARLDGLPLAIELAAARIKLLPPEQILARLSDSLSVLGTGPRTAPERHRTLRATIDWSYELLDEVSRRLFARLAVFTGGWTLESAEAVCEPSQLGLDALDGLAALAERSLIRRSDEGGPRFSMLETIREFALERLAESGQLDRIRERHAAHFLDLAVEAEPHLTGRDQAEWLDRCEEEHPNIRAALEWAIEAGDAQRAQRAAGALWRFWQQRGHLAEARRWFDRVLALPSGPTEARAAALIGAGGIAWWQVDRGNARACYEEAVEVRRALGDPAGIAEALYNLSFPVAAREGVEAAARLLDEALVLFRRADDHGGTASVLTMLVIRDAEAGNWPAVVAKLEEVVGTWRGFGDRYQLANSLVWLAISSWRVGRPAEARAAALEALDLFQEVNNATGIALAFRCLAFLGTWAGRHREALRLATVSETLDQQVGAGLSRGFAGLLEGDPASEARGHLAQDQAREVEDEARAMTVQEAASMARAMPLQA